MRREREKGGFGSRDQRGTAKQHGNTPQQEKILRSERMEHDCRNRMYQTLKNLKKAPEHWCPGHCKPFFRRRRRQHQLRLSLTEPRTPGEMRRAFRCRPDNAAITTPIRFRRISPAPHPTVRLSTGQPAYEPDSRPFNRTVTRPRGCRFEGHRP